ncbi:protein ApaG [Vreelandella aquamarina]|nr:protein ApaG [Halomonas axialensis]
MSGLDIEVSVTPEFRDAESSDSESRYVFSYTVTVHNQSPHSVQLMARYWKITQGSGDSQEVRGKGVVGQQPLIGPGQRFRYTSRAILQTPVGVMEVPTPCLIRIPSGLLMCPFRLFV